MSIFVTREQTKILKPYPTTSPSCVDEHPLKSLLNIFLHGPHHISQLIHSFYHFNLISFERIFHFIKQFLSWAQKDLNNKISKPHE
jgi:hypothetical protein